MIVKKIAYIRSVHLPQKHITSLFAVNPATILLTDIRVISTISTGMIITR